MEINPSPHLWQGSNTSMKTDTFEYKSSELTFRGYLAYDEAKLEKRPGVLVVHEAWGLDEHARSRAERLAQLGYAALAVDMFGDGKQATGVQEGLQLIQELNNDPKTLRSRIQAAYEALLSVPQVDRSRVAGIGYCFGGQTVLELARSGAPVAGVVSFHGALQTKMPAQPGKVKAKILVCTGADDPFIPLDQVNAFINEMREAGTDYQVIIYGNTKHAFTNPKAAELGLQQRAYNQSSDERSWAAMESFFHEIFPTTPSV